MQIAVGEHDEAAVLRLGVFARLFLADERILVPGLGFEDEEREAPGVEQEKVDVAFCGFLEVVAERLQVGRLDRNAGFEANVRGRVASLKKSPAGRFEQLVDLDAGGGFFIRHSVPQ